MSKSAASMMTTQQHCLKKKKKGLSVRFFAENAFPIILHLRASKGIKDKKAINKDEAWQNPGACGHWMFGRGFRISFPVCEKTRKN